MGKSLPPLGNCFACAQRRLSSSIFVTTSLWTFLTPFCFLWNLSGMLWRNNTTFGQSPSPYPYQGNPPRRNILKRVREHAAPLRAIREYNCQSAKGNGRCVAYFIFASNSPCCRGREMDINLSATCTIVSITLSTRKIVIPNLLPKHRGIIRTMGEERKILKVFDYHRQKVYGIETQRVRASLIPLAYHPLSITSSLFSSSLYATSNAFWISSRCTLLRK
jgi:hypothetical protein